MKLPINHILQFIINIITLYIGSYTDAFRVKESKFIKVPQENGHFLFPESMCRITSSRGGRLWLLLEASWGSSTSYSPPAPPAPAASLPAQMGPLVLGSQLHLIIH